MLIFTRKIGKSIVVTGLPGRTRELKLSVVEIQDGRVRLGFETETDVAIDRSEVWDQKGGFGNPIDSETASIPPLVSNW